MLVSFLVKGENGETSVSSCGRTGSRVGHVWHSERFALAVDDTNVDNVGEGDSEAVEDPEPVMDDTDVLHVVKHSPTEVETIVMVTVTRVGVTTSGHSVDCCNDEALDGNDVSNIDDDWDEVVNDDDAVDISNDDESGNGKVDDIDDDDDDDVDAVDNNDDDDGENVGVNEDSDEDIIDTDDDDIGMVKQEESLVDEETSPSVELCGLVVPCKDSFSD